MDLKEYSLHSTKDAPTGELELVIEYDGEEFTIQFEFIEAAIAPWESSPIPMGSTEIYAWPSDSIPSELTFEKGHRDAILAVVLEQDDLPEHIHLLDGPYTEVDQQRNPFIIPDD